MATKKVAAKKKTTKAKASKASKSKTSKTSKSKTSSTSKAKTSRATASSSKPSVTVSSGDKPIKIKQMTKFERLEEARKAFKWWEAEDLPEGIHWRYLEHTGVVFPPSYKAHGVPIKYDGNILPLNNEQEELATFYAAIPEDGLQLGNKTTRAIFQNNFLNDFKTAFSAGEKLNDFEKFDFSVIREHLDLQKNLKKVATDEEKEQKKLEKQKTELEHGYALVDGRLEKLGNYNMEPPGLFRGRGEHPKMGCLKKRTFAESVSLNISEDACVPKCSIPGHAWQSVRHDPTVTWLCSWTENVQSQNKYVMLAASSSFKGKSDQEKYQTAINLHASIDKVRADYTKNIRAEDRATRQLGVAMWVIDKLALRVGGEKGEEEADTYGCCSLQVEHLQINPDSESTEIGLEFLGKDSMLFKQVIDFSTYGKLGLEVYRCLKSFCAGKSESDQVFETLTPAVLNKHLTSLMPGLTAKVFRTYNASITLQNELPSAEELEGLSVQDKVLRYNAANRQVAILCNHQRTVSKATESMFENLQEKLATVVRQKKELGEWLALVKKGKEDKIPLMDDDSDKVKKLQDRLQKALDSKETAQSTEAKLAAAKEIEEARAAVKQDQQRRFSMKHMYKSTPSESSVQGRLEKWTEDLKKMELDVQNKEENKEVALGTSKINYMDPRISVAWCKRCEVPIDKVFAKTLRDKFNWAMAVPPDYIWGKK